MSSPSSGCAVPCTRPRSRRFVGILLALAASLFSATTASAADILSSDFEDGTTQGWWGFGGSVTAVNTTAAAHGGSHALEVANRADTWQGVATDARTLLSANTVYTVSAWVKLKAGEAPAELRFTAQRQPTGGGFSYTDITPSTAVTDSAWVQITGTYSFTDASNDVLNLYVQSNSATVAFYIDDIKITTAATAPSFNFDDGTAQGWFEFGPTQITATTAFAQAGTHSLLVTNRDQNWQGTGIDLRGKIDAVKVYRVTAWVRLTAGTPATNGNLFVVRAPAGGADEYATVINNVPVNDSTWTKLEGFYSMPTSANDKLILWASLSDATASFYLDTVSIEELPAFSCPEPHDQSGLFADFDLGTTDGWAARGDSTVTVVNTTSHSAPNSLAVTGRTASWQGASIDALCKFHKGSKYSVSVWAKMLPGQPASNLHLTFESRFNDVTSYRGITPNVWVTDAAWVNISATVNFDIDADHLTLYIESDSGTSSFYIDDFIVSYVPIKPIQTDIPSLKDVLAPYFSVGAAMQPWQTSGRHGDLAKKHMNSVSPENAMKWDSIEPTEGNFSWADADQIANFARANGMKMRGHTFIWHNQTPAWVFRDAANNPLVSGNPAHRALLLQRMRTHIHAMIARYGDVVDTWDVVNEVVSDTNPATLRDSDWLRIVGPDYIDRAFEYAAEASGSAKLAINEYDTHLPHKRAFLKSLVQGMLSRGVKVNSIGHQMHINNYVPTIADLNATFDDFTPLGLDQQVTELDVSLYSNYSDSSIPITGVLLQGQRYKELYDVFRSKAPKLSRVVTWGLGDDTSWLKYVFSRDDKPLIFDEELQAKPAYWGIVDPTKLPVIPQVARAYQSIVALAADTNTAGDSLVSQALGSRKKVNISGAFKTQWTEHALWVQVDVVTPSKQNNDTISFFVDENNDKGSSTSDDHVHTFSGPGLSTSNGASAKLTPTQTGYRIVALIPITKSLTRDSTIGFDVRVATKSSSAQKLSWSDITHKQETDLTSRGTLLLGAPRRVAEARKGTPVIDGNLDNAWKKVKPYTTNQFVMGGSGATATVRTLWDSGHIYVYAEVKDSLLSDTPPNPWEQDSFELFLDENNAQLAPYDGDDAQYRINYKNVLSYGGAAAPAKIASAVKLTPTGYIVEAAFAVNPTYTKQGAFLGYDFQVNNTNGGGVRDSVSTFNDTIGSAYRDASQFGALLLVK